MGFQPFFGRNNIEMVELRKQIGDEAATKIQAWWHNVKPKMQDKEGIPPDQQSGEEAFGSVEDLAQMLQAGMALEDCVQEVGNEDLLQMRRAMFGDSDDDEDHK